MICKKCGSEFDGAFCPNCGERAEAKMTVCPVCGKEREEGENFCSKCGYAFEGQATATQKTHAKITFDKEALIGGVRKFYKTSLNIGKVFFSLLLLLILASPIMLHDGINTAGSGYTNAFNLYVDGRFTAVCAILMIIAFYSLIYGVYSCIKFFVFRNKAESKASKFMYFAFSLVVFIVCCIGCSGAGEWFADAGAGLSFGIFVGLVGMALSILRYIFEDKFVNSDGSQTVEVSDDVKAVEKKMTKKVKLGTAVVTGVLVIAVIITSIVQGVYTNPFSSTSYNFAETRADVIKQFGMPENAKEDSSSYTYYSTEYAAAERMIDALIAAQDKQLTDGFESDADSFDEDDFESMFDGVAGIDGIIEKLEEKQENIKYKKSVVTFNNDGGDDRSNDTIKSYVCEVIMPAVEGEEKEERTLTKLKIKNGYYFSYDKSAEFEYLAKYNDGSFSGGIITLNSDSYDEDKNTYTYTDSLGKYTVSSYELEMISGEVYVKDSILYIVGDTSNALGKLSSDALNKIKKIEIKQGVTSVEYSGEKTLSNLEEISAPDSLVCFSISIIKDSKFYNNVSNWENGKVLYIGNLLAEAKEDLSSDYIVREGTTAINENAFEECVNLTSITIPDSVTSIGAEAFRGTAIVTANIPAFAISSIPESNLSEVVINSGESIGNRAFEGCSSLTSITIPASVTSIGSSAFEDCSSLTSVNFGENSKLESIGSSAFEDCSSLTSVNFGENSKLESIGEYAFYNCSSLTSITIPSSVTSIGLYAFYNCSSLTEINYNAVSAEDLTSSSNVFYNAGKNADGITVVFGESVERIPAYLFYVNYSSGNPKIISVTIGNGVTSIGYSAFSDCSSLEAVYITDIKAWCNISFENSLSNPLSYAANLYLNGEIVTELVIPDGVTSIGGSAFYGCGSLTSIIIPDSVTSMGSYAFSGCSSLASVTIPSSVTSIGSSAFSGCKIAKANIPAFAISDIPKSYLRDVVINSGESIDNRAFEDCSTLTSITIPDSVKSIGAWAFSGCSSLTSITIPASVTSIGSDAFYNCSSLTIYCKAASKPSGWGSNWNNGRPVVWNSNNNDVASDGYIYYVAENGVRYALKDGSATIARQSEGLSGDIEIPSSISYKGNAYTVTSIGSSAFYNCSSLTSITIPASVTSIGSYAFYYCSSLEKIEVEKGNSVYHSEGNCLINTTTKTLIVGCKNSVIPDDGSVTSIGSYAFYGCSSLTSINIPNSVTSIGDYAFRDCSSLTSVTFEENSKLESIGDVAFYNCSSLTSINIPNSVTSIGDYAFRDCSSLTSVTFEENSKFESIGDVAFYNCSSLTSITIPDSVTSIGSSAFSGCSSLESITLPFIGAREGVTSSDTYQYPLGYIFGTSSYTGGTSVTQYYYGSSTSYTDSTTYYIPSTLRNVTVTGGNILYGAFSHCNSLTNITIPGSVTSIGSSVFYNCSSLTSITIPDSVTSIGYYAFSGCSSLTSITIPDSVTSIDYGAFEDCSSLTSVTFGDSSQLESIGSQAFRACSSLTSITIPGSVTSIGSYAFEDCSSLCDINVSENNANYKSADGNLYSKDMTELIQYAIGKSDTSFTIPDGVTSIGDYAFRGCSSLTSITIPDSVKSIGAWAFSGCSSLTSITIPDSVKSIGAGAFSGCSSLTSVTFGDSSNLESIGSEAFRACSSLTSITIPDSVTSIGSQAFRACSSLTSITIPDSVTSIGSSAFNSCSSLTSITIPDSVTSIGSSAFYYCSSLTSITIPDSVTRIDYEAFYYCSSLTSVNFGENSQLESIGDYAFNGCSSLTSITIPDSVTSIGEDAFYKCSSLTSVNFGDNSQLESIGSQAFRACSSLTSITIPDSVTSIGDYAFRDCSSLTSVTIPDSVTSIGEYAFRYCNSLTIYCEAASEPSGWDGNWNRDICPVVWNCNNNDVASDGYIYYVAENGVRYALKDGSATVARQSEGLSGDVKLPSSISYKGNAHAVTSIGSYAFYNCSSLTSVNFGENSQLESIGDYAFRGCSSLTSLTIPGSVTSIGNWAFDSCSSLTSLTIHGSVTSIGNWAFDSCSSLKSVTFGDNSQLESIGSYAFWGCSSLKSVTIPDSVTSIGDYAFRGCSSLTSVIFKNTQGWWRSSSSSATSGTSISSSDLADPATAAKYLTGTYYNYYWKRG